MASAFSALLTLLSFALLISVVVFFHELGHLLVARRLGVKALKFSLGFGPRIFSFTRGGTEYMLSVLPFGGYVKFAGDNPYEEVPPEHKGHGFLEATPGARAAIAFAGPAANFLLALVVYFGLALLPMPQLAPVIGFVRPGSPAAQAKLQAYDRIERVDGEPVRSFLDVQEHVQRAAGRAVEFALDREGQKLTVQVVPASVETKNPVETVKQGRIGISAVPRVAQIAPLSPDGLAGRAGLRTFDKVTMLEGTAVKSYEHLVSLVGRRLADGTAITLSLQGTRPLGPPAAPGDEVKNDPFRVTLAIPAHAAKVYALEETEQLLGLVSADLSLAIVKDKSPAQKAGLLRGDRVVAFNHKPVVWWIDDVEPARREAGEAPVTFTIARDGKTLDVVVQQELKKERDESGVRVHVPELGAQPDFSILRGEPEYVTVRYGLVEAARRSVVDTAGAVRLMALGLWKMVIGHIPSEAVGGPLMIADVARQAADAGWQVFLATMALISMNLGMMNLLPIPVLDGFHIVSAGIEGVRKKPLSLKFREVTNLVGLAMVLALMLFAIRNDVMRKFFD